MGKLWDAFTGKTDREETRRIVAEVRARAGARPPAHETIDIYRMPKRGKPLHRGPEHGKHSERRHG